MRFAFSIFLAVALTGCINTVKHVPLGQTTSTYAPTRFVACDAVGVWWNDSYSRKYPIEASWFRMTWLVWVVDLPFEAVADTLWFPYDMYSKVRYERHAMETGNGGTRFGSDLRSAPYELKTDTYEIDIGK